MQEIEGGSWHQPKVPWPREMIYNLVVICEQQWWVAPWLKHYGMLNI